MKKNTIIPVALMMTLSVFLVAPLAFASAHLQDKSGGGTHIKQSLEAKPPVNTKSLPSKTLLVDSFCISPPGLCGTTLTGPNSNVCCKTSWCNGPHSDGTYKCQAK
ncbi:MAG: hypothetical protein Q8R24_03840 [Legionellaceae bacterium]|nr:hypothetical protein [Legionellaceae bacterium]